MLATLFCCCSINHRRSLLHHKKKIVCFRKNEKFAIHIIFGYKIWMVSWFMVHGPTTSVHEAAAAPTVFAYVHTVMSRVEPARRLALVWWLILHKCNIEFSPKHSIRFDSIFLIKWNFRTCNICYSDVVPHRMMPHIRCWQAVAVSVGFSFFFFFFWQFGKMWNFQNMNMCCSHIYLFSISIKMDLALK